MANEPPIAPVPKNQQTPPRPTTATAVDAAGNPVKPVPGGTNQWGGGTTVAQSGADQALSDAEKAQKALSDQLDTSAANPVSRPAPQVTAPGAVVSDVTNVAKPTATAAAAPDKVVAPTIGTTTIAPAAQVTASQVAPTTGATAGQVTAAQVDTSQQAQFRAQQQRLTDALEAAASGNAPSAAQIQAKQSSDEAMASQLAMVGMNHGRGANAALRTAGRNVAAIQQKAALDNALIRATESATARGQEATVLGQGREQDIGLATKQADLNQGAGTTNAGLNTQVSISNADRDAARAMKDADLKQAAAAGNAAAQNELAERQAALDAAVKTQNAANAIDVGKANQGADLTTNLANAAASNTASIVGATEENKVGLTNAQQDLTAQLANQDNATKVSLANAGFTLEGRKIDDAANVDAVNAALKGQAQLAGTVQEQQRFQLARDQFNQAIKEHNTAVATQILTSILGATATVGAGYLGGSTHAAPDASGSAATPPADDTYDSSYVDSLPVTSDRRAKKSIKRESTKNVNAFIDALEASSYTYKNPDAPGSAHGRMSGPMAQELEKSLIGRSAVKIGPDGQKMVDTGRLTMALAGAVARLAKQKRRAA